MGISRMEIEKEKYKELIAGYLSGNLSDEEYDRLNSWIEDDDRNVAYLNEYSQVWLASMAISNPKEFDTKNAFNKFEQRISASNEALDKPDVVETSRLKINYVFLRIAALIILSFGLGFGANYLYNNKTVSSLTTYQEIAAPLGSQTHVLLPDQSVVLLNAGSKIRYYSDYGVKNREVWLQGEGYFTVTKNKTKGFIVRAGSLAITALGTQFNVKAYPMEGVIETALVEGKVRIERIKTNENNQKMVAGIGFLNPKERLIYKEDNVEKLIKEPAGEDTPYEALIRETDLDVTQFNNISFEKNVDLRPFISWKGKRWIIKGEELSKLAIKLERKYDIKISFESERLKHLRFSGILEDESIEQVFKAVSLSAPVLFSIDGKNVYLKYNNQFMTMYGRAYNE